MANQANMDQAKNIASAFSTHYYNMFDTNRAQLESLYVDCSILQFENDTHMGKVEVMKKLVGLPMATVKHILTTVDGQPTIDGGVIVHVIGQLKTDDDHPHAFSESFHLKKDPSNPASFVILNEIFRLSVHHG